jgi:aconitate hydratase
MHADIRFRAWSALIRSTAFGIGHRLAALPLRYLPGESAASLGLTGHEVIDGTGIEELNGGSCPARSRCGPAGGSLRAVVRVGTPGEAGYCRTPGPYCMCCGHC